MPEPGAGSIAELLDLLRYPLYVIDVTRLDPAEFASWRPGARIPCAAEAFQIVRGPDVPPWEVARRLLEEPDA